MTETDETPPLRTDCRTCVFAPAEPGGDCGTGRLSRFRALGLAEETSEGGLSVRDRLCNTCWRADAPWVAETPGADRPRLARERASLRFRGVVLVQAPSTAEAVCDALRGLASQTHKPVELAVVLNADAPGYGALVQAVRKADLGVPWRVRLVEERDAAGGFVPAVVALDRELLGDAPVEANYAAVVGPEGNVLRADWLELVDRAVNDELRQVGAVGPAGPDSLHGLTVSLGVWTGDPEYCLRAPRGLELSE